MLKSGDLMQATKDSLPKNQKDYWAFAHAMAHGDRVLVMAHHFPFGLVRIAGEYNYVRRFAPEIGVWFRHFRKVDDIHFYADVKTKTDVRKWNRLIMKDTISPLHNESSQSYVLIEDWLRRLAYILVRRLNLRFSITFFASLHIRLHHHTASIDQTECQGTALAVPQDAK